MKQLSNPIIITPTRLLTLIERKAWTEPWEEF